jgi:alkylated DNA repair dioxygenase AlkB
VSALNDLAWQTSLLGAGAVGIDWRFATLERRELAGGAWVDHAPGWLSGADEVFAALLRTVPWQQHDRWMYDRRVTEPRLTVRYDLEAEAPPHPVLAEAAAALGERYGVEFVALGCNLYRDGRDSVAWHGDRIARDLPEATIAIISLGEIRPFKLRPKRTGGGKAITYRPGPGDLLVLGGSCQRTWQHAVPKVRRAGPRISVQLRHAYD